jgi:hypothetical protein
MSLTSTLANRSRSTFRLVQPVRGAREIDNPLQWLLDTGNLFEFNRCLLHPTGRAMAVRREDDGTLVPVVYDFTDNPTVTFDEETFRIGQARYKAFLDSTGTRVANLRRRVLGFIQQTTAKVKRLTRRG